MFYVIVRHKTYTLPPHLSNPEARKVMALTLASHETNRIKLLLASAAIIMIGITFAVLPVQGTQTDASVANFPIGSTTTFILGSAQSNYVINVYMTVAGTVRLTINNIDPSHSALTLYNSLVYSSGAIPPVMNTLAGTIQITVNTYGGSSATLNASIQHTATTYPLQIPGLFLLVAGAAVILTRVYRVKVSVSPSIPIQ